MFDAIKKALSSLSEKVRGAVAAPKEEPPAEPQAPEPPPASPGEEPRPLEGLGEAEERTSQEGPPKGGPAGGAGERRERVEGAEGPREAPGKAGEPPSPSPSEKERGPIGGRRKAGRPKAQLKARLSLTKRLKGLIEGKVKLEEKDIAPALEEFELHLLRAEVALPVVEELKERLRKALINREVPRSRVGEEVGREAVKVLTSAVKGASFTEWLEGIGERPVVIMLFGPNGSGKTTTAAKLAHLLKGRGLKVLLIGADTFRAASIEQLKEHGARIGVEVFEKGYGVKPSAVIYQGLEKARREGYDVVIIDTAGRQEVNANLMKELEKMVKVARPHLKLYVVESIGGNAVFNQVATYNRLVGIDGLIITKLDLDERGGVLLSASHTAQAPIFFLSLGQGYSDLKEYSPQLVEGILHDSG